MYIRKVNKTERKKNKMKNYNFTQVRKALEKKNYAPDQSYSSDTEYTTVFEKQGLPSHSTEYVYVEEWKEDGTCKIDGMCPNEWGKQKFA